MQTLNGYVRRATFTFEEGLERIKNTNSKRLLCFVNSRRCVTCGLMGVYWAEESSINKTIPGGLQGWHLNLYGVRRGREVMFTKDHIRPASKGGRDTMDNLQTMCCTCNVRKGNKYQ